ncbi:hypothetical protein N8579_00495 [bacterium]|jgi:hypothetical protein|nr:hypothetical protein [bacterium]
MKTAALLYVRNDDYKENERVIVTLSSMLDTFDEVILLDWNTPKGKTPLFWEIQDKLPKTGRLKHMVIPPNAAAQLTNYDPKAQACTQVLSSNIMLRRTDADWIVATTIDIIAPKKETLNAFLSKADKNTFYTLSRRDFEISELEEFGFNRWKEYRDILDNKSKPRYYPAKVSPNDDYSIINCCGDFQMAHKDVWNKIKGYEEKMMYACFQDTNIQKKAVLNGCGLMAIYDIPFYHMSHKGMGNDGSSPSKQHYNDVWKWVEHFQTSENLEDWGFSNIEIEYEIY